MSRIAITATLVDARRHQPLAGPKLTFTLNHITLLFISSLLTSSMQYARQKHVNDELSAWPGLPGGPPIGALYGM